MLLTSFWFNFKSYLTKVSSLQEAQKVKKDFAEIEREAELADLGRQKAVEEEKTTSCKPKIEDVASLRLPYQELLLDQKKTEDKIRTVDPKKANQVRYFPILLKFIYSG